MQPKDTEANVYSFILKSPEKLYLEDISGSISLIWKSPKMRLFWELATLVSLILGSFEADFFKSCLIAA